MLAMRMCKDTLTAFKVATCCMYPLLELHALKWVGLSLGHISICSYGKVENGRK